MRSMLRFRLLVMLSAMLSTGTAYAAGWGEITSRLAVGMTEQQVMAAVGSENLDSAEVRTCGTQTQNGAWQCKIMNFRVLHVFFAADNKGAWHVNGWQMTGWQ